MYAICLRYSSNSDEAKDLLHDGFIKLFDKIGQFTEYGKFEAWMHRLFTNHCIDFVRSAYKKHTKNSVEYAEHHETDEMNFDEEINSDFDPLNYEPQELIDAIQLLQPDFRLVLNLYAIENKSHHEIADIMKIETATSRSKLMRARQALKKLLEKKQKHAKN
jgi:RNA polymerase sigma-70 factor (ECF subfamily)